MRFTDGAWRTAEGFNIHPAREVRFIQTDEKKIKLTAPAYHVGSRGNTLSGPYITVEISSPFENAFHIRTYHFKGDGSFTPSYFDLNDKSATLSIEDSSGLITIRSGDSCLIINKENFMKKQNNLLKK